MYRRTKKIVLILDRARDGKLEAYVTHTVDIGQCRRLNILAARAYASGSPYDDQSFPAAGWLASILEAGREPIFLAVDEVENATIAEKRKVAWIHTLDRSGIRVPVQERGVISGIEGALLQKLEQEGINFVPNRSRSGGVESPLVVNSYLEEVKLRYRGGNAAHPTHKPWPWMHGAISFLDPASGRVLPYQPGNALGPVSLNVVSGVPGCGKSTFLRKMALGAIAIGPKELPEIAILDVDSSWCGLSRILSDMTGGRSKQFQSLQLRMDGQHRVNPFDTSPGERFPSTWQRCLALNVLTEVLTRDAEAPAQFEQVKRYAEQLVDLAYRTFSDTVPDGSPRLYREGIAEDVDRALKKIGYDASDRSFWRVSDILRGAGYSHEALSAQRLAVPQMQDLLHLCGHPSLPMFSMQNECQATAIRQDCLEAVRSRLSKAMRDIPLLIGGTNIAFSPSTRIRALDIGPSCPRTSQTWINDPIVWLLGRKLVAQGFSYDLGLEQSEPSYLIADELDHMLGGYGVTAQLLNDQEMMGSGGAIFASVQSVDRLETALCSCVTTLWVMGVYTPRCAAQIRDRFHLSEQAVDKIIRDVSGPPSPGILKIYACLRNGDEQLEQLLHLPLDIDSQWALTTDPQQGLMLAELATLMGWQSAVRNLGQHYPRDSFRKELSYRLSVARDAGMQAPNAVLLIKNMAEQLYRRCMKCT